MEGQIAVATKQDLDYIQSQMKNVYATQAEHADRLTRLEQRPEPDSRSRSAWGNQSPFSGLLNGSSQHGMLPVQILTGHTRLTYFFLREQLQPCS